MVSEFLWMGYKMVAISGVIIFKLYNPSTVFLNTGSVPSTVNPSTVFLIMKVHHQPFSIHDDKEFLNK
jgi:hypothetical protein